MPEQHCGVLQALSPPCRSLWSPGILPHQSVYDDMLCTFPLTTPIVRRDHQIFKALEEHHVNCEG